jgi:peptidoglycan DL-endopeptidase CwlO
VSRHIRNFCLVALASGLLGSLVAPAVAGAQTIDDKRAQAAALQLKIEATNEELSGLGEQFNGAQLRLEQAEAEVIAVQASIDATRAQIADLRAQIRERAAAVYRRGTTNNDSGLSELDSKSAEDAARSKKYASAEATRVNKALSELATLKQALADQKQTASAARDTAAAERQKLEETKASLEAASAEQQRLLGQVQGEIAQLVQQELDRRQAEALAAASSQYGNSPESFTDLPPPGPSTAKAIDFAYAQMGKVYVYAAIGPDHYDCSGLVMTAFKTAGVALPHYSGAQYNKLPHVPLNAMQRGDLVFWGGGGSSHVAIYLGGGQIIESGGSGHNVHVGAIWGHPSGAARVVS